MNVIDLPTDHIVAAEMNANEMDDAMRVHLHASIERYGLVVPLVVRESDDHHYETIGGAQRLTVVRDMGFESVPCVVVDADGAEALLLAQALNHIAGQDNLGLRAEVVRSLLEDLPQDEVLAVLPESADSLRALASLGIDDIADQLANWERAQAAKLRHLQFQLTSDQLAVVDEALQWVMTDINQESTNPNKRGNALFTLCERYLDQMEAKT